MTPIQLRTAALQELGVVGIGKNASAADSAIVQSKYEALYDMLLAERLVSWAIASDVPDYAEIPVTWMLAFMCVGTFAVPQEKMIDLTAKGALNMQPMALGEKMLRRQLAKTYIPHSAQPDYF